MLEYSLRSPASLTYAFALLGFLAFLVHLALAWRGGWRALVLLVSVATSAAWAALNLGFALSRSAALWPAEVVMDATRLACWLLFVTLLLQGQVAAKPRAAEGVRSPSTDASRITLAPADAGHIFGWPWLLLLALPLAAWLVPSGPPLPIAGATDANARAPYGIFLAASVVGLVLTEQLFRRTAEHTRWSIKPLCLGLGASFVFDLYMNADALLFGHVDPSIWAARGVAQALVIPFIGIATARNKDWTIDIAISRGMVFNSVALLATGLYLLAVAAAGYYVRYFGGSWGQTIQVGFIFGAMLLLGWLFSSGTLRSKLRVFINKNFFSYRYDYREEWLRFTSLLSSPSLGAGTQQRCIQALANLVESPAGALWLRDEGGGAFMPAARWNLPEIRAQEGADQPLAQFLARTGWVINISEVRAQPERYPGLRLPMWFAALPAAWLVVPIVAQDALVGFAVLANPRTAIELNWEVLDLLKTAARQAGSFLGHIQSTEALLEARKFDAFHKMAAFLTHDVKNLVAQLSLLLKNAERHRADPRFQADMLTTVRHVVDRMNRLLLQLRPNTEVGEALTPTYLGRTAERVAAAKAGQHATIELETSQEAVALAHEQRLERVVGNLVQNAIDATAPGGQVRVRVRAGEAEAVLEVVDTGCGMTEEFLREKLFRPFQTTKLNGTGIGAYETAQYVRELGGRIEAESRQSAGTTIRIVLPSYADTAAAEAQYANRIA